jgi:hypothetical protein
MILSLISSRKVYGRDKECIPNYCGQTSWETSTWKKVGKTTLGRTSVNRNVELKQNLKKQDERMWV